jgi:hypothetical protein
MWILAPALVQSIGLPGSRNFCLQSCVKTERRGIATYFASNNVPKMRFLARDELCPVLCGIGHGACLRVF